MRTNTALNYSGANPLDEAAMAQLGRLMLAVDRNGPIHLAEAPISDQFLAQLARLGRHASSAQVLRDRDGGPTDGSSPLTNLTQRELEVVTRLRGGVRVPRIAADLFLSQSTVRNHLASAMHKLGVRTQQDLLMVLHTEPALTESER